MSAPDWLNAVPSGWAVAPLYARYEVQLGKMLDTARFTGTSARPYLRNTDVQWDSINVTDLPVMDFESRDRLKFSLRPGDLLVCEGGEIGRTAIWRGELEECYFQKAIHRLRPRCSAECPRYLYYALRAAADHGLFAADSNLNTISHLTAEKLRRHRFPFPPSNEQRAITDFLDRETAKIGALITKYRQLTDLLAEQRFSTIHDLITTGIGPSQLSDSGHEWIGSVPSHWSVVKTKFVARLATGHTPSREHPEYWVDCDIPWFSLADVWQLRSGRQEYLGDTSEKISQLGLANSAAVLLPAGTVIVSRTASVGFSGIMPVPMATTQDFVNWVCGPKIKPEYLLYVFRSMRNEFQRLTMGSTHKTIYMPDVADFVTPLPPIYEQDSIVRAIREKTEVLDRLADALVSECDRLNEYRSSLISAAVTGQIDVRAYRPQEAAVLCQ